MLTVQQVRRPLVGVALSVATGLGLHHFVGGSPLLLLGVTALLLAGACRTAIFRGPLIYVTCGLLAAAHISINEIPSLPRAVLSSAETDVGRPQIIGTIKNEPVALNSDGTVSFLMHVNSVLYDGGKLSSDDVLKVYLREPSVSARFGEIWELRGRYTGYEHLRGGASGSLSVSAGDAVRLRAAGPSLMRICHRLRRWAADILRSGIGAFPDQIGLLQALLLGYRQAMPPELYRLFARTGILHIFAISGLHVGVMAAILIAALKLIGIPRPRWGWFLIPVLFLYVYSTGMKASALRAFTMAAVYFAAPLAGRRPDAPSAVALAAVLLLAVNPANINDPGFLLSFVVVCGIILVHGWVVRQINGMRFSGWETPLRGLNGRHPAAALGRAVSLLAITSLAAWIFSAPITAHFFNTLSPAALVGNLAVIPLTFMIMLTGCLTLLSGILFLPAAVLFNQANVQIISLLIWIVRRFSALPAAGLAVRSPSVWVVGLWYTGLVFFLTGPARWRKACGLLVLLAGLLWSTEQIRSCKEIKILREGDSAVAFCSPGERRWTLITDGNPFSTTRTIRLLQREGLNRLDTLAVSGGRADTEAIRRFQETFCPQQILYTNEIDWAEGRGEVRIRSGY
jgi:ComEC/Rec2-related protein